MGSYEEVIAASKLLRPAHVLLDRLRTHFYSGPGVDDLVWVWPNTLMPDAVEYMGVPVQHADVPEPLLAHRLADKPRPPVCPDHWIPGAGNQRIQAPEFGCVACQGYVEG